HKIGLFFKQKQAYDSRIESRRLGDLYKRQDYTQVNIFDISHLPYFRKIQQEIFNGSERTAVRGGGTDAKKPTGEAGFFAIPDRSW
ncbi:hypothetical protein ACQKB9_26500, partial [Escherichia coli]|uniref:hypothetical protein n=1 Tax=Escherichia coli TaxID=562 RepID=UPI003CFD7028